MLTWQKPLAIGQRVIRLETERKVEQMIGARYQSLQGRKLCEFCLRAAYFFPRDRTIATRTMDILLRKLAAIAPQLCLAPTKFGETSS